MPTRMQDLLVEIYRVDVHTLLFDPITFGAFTSSGTTYFFALER